MECRIGFAKCAGLVSGVTCFRIVRWDMRFYHQNSHQWVLVPWAAVSSEPSKRYNEDIIQGLDF